MLPDLRVSSGIVVAAKGANADYYGDRPNVGDVIHAVNAKAVTSVDDLKEALGTLKADDPLVLQIERAGELAYLVLERD